MLIQLDIENVAVIEKASIEFDNGFNIITGETGAGKSLLINSLNLILGGRASREIIRSGAQHASVGAVFFVKNAQDIVKDAGIECDDGQIVITRKVFADGRNICRVNSVPVNVGTLKIIGDRLVTIHGQRESAMLYNQAEHIGFLDAYAKDSALLEKYQNAYGEYKNSLGEYEKLDTDEKTRINEIDYLSFQVNEIEKANLSEDEENELLKKRSVLENAKALREYATIAYESINGERGAKELLYNVRRSVQKLSELDSSADFCDRADNLYYECEELGADLLNYLETIDVGEENLDKIDDRLDTINTLKRKYNTDIKGILEFYDEACARLSKLQAYDENKRAAYEKMQNCKNEAQKAAKELTELRKKSAAQLEKSIEAELSMLDMPRCRVKFELLPCELSAHGAENVQILVSTNPAESPKSIAAIASGGEMSRIMLAFKSVFTEFGDVPTLLFDEIDTGVSGRAAEKIALKMHELAKKFQIICVSHLPIMAAAADYHLVLSKVTENDNFSTSVKKVEKDDREREIARIIGGDNVSDVALQNARQLLGIFHKN